MSAYLNCKYWKSESFFPNCLRVLIYFLEASRQKAAPPKLQLAMLILPPSNAFIAILNPSPYFPIRFAAGILTLSKVTKAVGCMVHPILSSFLPQLIPLTSAGTKKAETSVGDVLAITMQRPLKLPPEMNIFEPFNTYSSPSFLAKLFIALESDPESGSVKQQLEKSYIEMSLGRNLSLCYSFPNQSTIQQHMLWIVRYEAVGTHPVDKASKITDASSLLNPVPFLQQIAEQPISAASLKTSTGKYSIRADFLFGEIQGLTSQGEQVFSKCIVLKLVNPVVNVRPIMD